MVLPSFQVENKLKKVMFFRKTLSLADINVEIVLKMLFPTLSNADIQFSKKKPTWISHTTTKALPNTKYIELINKKELVSGVK